MLRWPLRDPKHLTGQRRRMLDAMADYPVYEPPHCQGPNHPRNLRVKGDEEYHKSMQQFYERGRENFNYFMENRDVRLTALRAFLAKFNVNMDIDDAGLSAVSAWCPGNCGALVANLRLDETRQAFFQHLAPWTEQWCGFNVIFDLGIFLGESLRVRNPRLHWISKPGGSEDGSAIHSGYEISGFRKQRDWLDPIGYLYSVCGNDEVDLSFERTGRFVSIDILIGKVRDFSTR